MFSGDFKNVISIIATDAANQVAEYITMHSSKKTIFAGYDLSPYSKTSYSIIIIRYEGFIS